MNVAYNLDCMEAMRSMQDKAFDLAVVDPPYGISIGRVGCGARSKKYDRRKSNDWDNAPPAEDYWRELFRVSKNQIIWGMNYFRLPPTGHFIVWDKHQPDGVTFAQAELAWTSFPGTSKKFGISSNGQPDRIHPTQKPVALYQWIFSRYAKPGDKILDTHLGSGSSRIAAYEAGLDFTGYEIDKGYFEAQEERFQAYTAQVSLFHGEAAGC